MRFQYILGLLFSLEAAALRFGNTPTYQVQKAAEERKAARSLVKRDDTDPELLYPAYNLSVPTDFFHNETRYEPHTNDTFNLRYWFDASYYKPGGPVFVLLSGETDGTGRLTFLQKGIVHQVIEATGGIGVILEHRYYGTSFPVPNLSVENLRFLSTEQALADVAYFAQHVSFEGIDEDLTAPNTPWIAYGGSYAGAQAAFLRVVYPDVFWGTISSSGVTAAITDYWEYFEPIRQFAPPDGIAATQTYIDVIDSILLNNTDKTQQLKDAFGLGGITNDSDFANVFTNGPYCWQSTNWDPDLNSPGCYYYFGNLSSTTVNYNWTEDKRETVQDLLETAGYGNDSYAETVLLNAIGYFGETSVSAWNASGVSQNDYFTLLNASQWQDEEIDPAGGRSWNYQVCTEWGYFQTGNTPKDIKPIVSRTLTLEYTSFFCGAAYNLTLPDTDKVNKYGNFSIEYDRLAIVGGNADPWRPATPLADSAPKRPNTIEKPFWEIAHGVHHWEENGIFLNQTTPLLPPYPVIWAQQYIKNFVVEWLKEFDSKNDHYEL
ncbi:serine carboxypeptidase S28-domain-containing protein [Lophiotrema nucula]|uniref:Serine carboxypeptidase S28-domain-containing protein n=1 Tax=Lophiotrema nucula TaxID=690887 RepID=A0A6A5ZMT4_9PLEO|nr:serine carboxypeptidase S28-domain-containing protein [Lophiotrema nucula]